MSDIEIRDLGREVCGDDFCVVIIDGEIKQVKGLVLQEILADRARFNAWLDGAQAEIDRQKMEMVRVNVLHVSDLCGPITTDNQDLAPAIVVTDTKKPRKKRADAGQPRKPRIPKAKQGVEDGKLPDDSVSKPDPASDPSKVVTEYTRVGAMHLPEGGYQVTIDFQTADGQEHAVAGKGKTPYEAALQAKSRLQREQEVTVHSQRLEWLLENNSIDFPAELRG